MSIVLYTLYHVDSRSRLHSVLFLFLFLFSVILTKSQSLCHAFRKDNTRFQTPLKPFDIISYGPLVIRQGVQGSELNYLCYHIVIT